MCRQRIGRLLVNGESVAFEGSATATHTGPMEAPAGLIPATNRKLEFKIHLKPPAGSPDSELTREATQEIEVKDGVPKVLQAP